VSSFPELGGWDSAPSRPSGEPVLKKKGSAQPGVARNSATVSVAATRLSRNIIVVLLDRRDAHHCARSPPHCEISTRLRIPGTLSRREARAAEILRNGSRLHPIVTAS